MMGMAVRMVLVRLFRFHLRAPEKLRKGIVVDALLRPGNRWHVIR